MNLTEYLQKKIGLTEEMMTLLDSLFETKEYSKGETLLKEGSYSKNLICKKHEVNPYQWLKYVLENILDTKASVLAEPYPQNFKKKTDL